MYFQMIIQQKKTLFIQPKETQKHLSKQTTNKYISLCDVNNL